MGKDKDKTAETEAEAVAEAEAETEAAAGAEDPVARLEAEIASLKDQLLRALAETENLRRRSQREREDAVRYAAVPLVRDLVGVADNLRRALDSVPAEAVDDDEHLKTLLAGVEMTEKELESVLARHNIRKIEPLGEPLDPHQHEAMFEVPDPDTPSGTVVRVLRAGYMLDDRLIRPAQVGVAKGGPRLAAKQTAQAADTAPEAEAQADEAAETGDRASAPENDGNGAAPGSRIDTSV